MGSCVSSTHARPASSSRDPSSNAAMATSLNDDSAKAKALKGNPVAQSNGAALSNSAAGEDARNSSAEQPAAASNQNSSNPQPNSQNHNPSSSDNEQESYPYVYDERLMQLIKNRFNKRLAKAAKANGETLSASVENAAAAANTDSFPNEKWRQLVMQSMSKLDDWDFDVHHLGRLCGDKPLIYMAFALASKYDLFKRLSIDEGEFISYLKRVQDMHRTNVPFHNCTHSADVLQGLNCLIRRGLTEYLSDEDVLATILAATIINVDHPGLDNNFQELVKSHMSTLFNGVSTLQYSACSQVFFMMQQNEDCNILKDLTAEQKNDIRESVMCMTLETDGDSTLDANVDKVLHNSSPIPGDPIFQELQSKLEKSCDFSDKNDVRILMRVAIKLSYWSFCCMRSNEIFVQSLRKLWMENFTQADIEREVAPEMPSLYGHTFSRPNSDEEYITLGKQFAFFLGKKLKPLLHAYVDGLLHRLKSAKNHLLANRKWMDEQFVKCAELRSIPQDDSLKESLLKNHEESNRRLRERPIPEQEKVIPIEEQNRKRRVQTEEQEQIESECRDQLVQRFTSDEWKTSLEGTEKIYALVDYDTIPEPLTHEESRFAIVKMFDRIDHWNFDVFALTKLLGGEALFLTSYVLFNKYDLLNIFNIERDVLFNFLKTVQQGYQMNPYHNAMHACDVMQVTNSIMNKGGMMDTLDNIDVMAAIISSMVHDYDHPGLNNAFQTHSSSYLATLYNDRSVLENHHCAQTFRIMREEKDCDIFRNMNGEQRRDARQTMVGMIISTDMTNHGKYIAAFNSRIEAESNFKNKDDIRLALQIAIKMADVSNPTRPLYLYLQWTENIITEFFMQGDKEAEYGLPVSPLMNRHTSVLSKGQLAFLQYIIVPMFNSFIQVFPKMEFTRKHITENQAHWESHSEIEKEQFAPGKWKDMHLED